MLAPFHLSTAFESMAATGSTEVLRIGLITDIHYCNADRRGNRYYRESFDKMTEAVSTLNQEEVDMAIEIGDLIDSPPDTNPELELDFLDKINSSFSKLNAERHYVLGNHCLGALKKEEFLSTVGRSESYYSFDAGGYHVIILDACFRVDGTPYMRGNFDWKDTEIPKHQQEWLIDDLEKTSFPVIVFVHQRVDGHPDDNYTVKSAPEVRQIFERSGKVVTVFQGHSHANNYQEINGIHYCVLEAMVEGSGLSNNGYSILHLYPDGSLSLEGFRKHANHELSRKQIMKEVQ